MSDREEHLAVVAYLKASATPIPQPTDLVPDLWCVIADAHAEAVVSEERFRELCRPTDPRPRLWYVQRADVGPAAVEEIAVDVAIDENVVTGEPVPEEPTDG